MTGVFVDVVGSTARAESLDPEDVRAMLAPYHACVRSELERFGGTVEKFIGDAVFALFGAPISHEDDAERAVRSAFAILDAVAELNSSDAWFDLHLRVGVHSGEALVMLDANPGEGDWMAAGDIVNTAARIQSAAPVDGVLVGELAYQATHAVIDYEQVDPIAAKGKVDPVRVWVARGVRREQTGGSQGRRLTMVGREEELQLLAREWDDVLRQQRVAVLTVLGPPGIGKSRLLTEFMESVGSATVHAARCLPYGEGITYWPVIEILKQAAGILQSDSAETDAAKLGALLDRLPTSDKDELRTMAAAVANLIGASSTPRGTYSVGEIGQSELHWGLRRVFQLLATEKPLLLVFEDLHWAEPTLLQLLRFIVADDAGAALMLLCSARLEFRDANAEFLGSASTIELETLDPSASHELLSELVGESAEANNTAVEALLRSAGGNPLFLEEIVEMLVDRGLVSEEGWQAGADLAALNVPTNLQALIGSRLDQLAPREKQVAQHAAVVGHIFWPGAVAHIEEDSSVDGALMNAISGLEHRDFVRPSHDSSVAAESEYAFKHILIRDVAYGQLPKGRRIPMHVRFAQWVTALPGTEDELVEIVAWHLEQACRLAAEVAHPPIPPPLREAADALSRAGAKAERREGLREANRYYERALELVQESLPAETAELHLRRGLTLTALGDLKQACEELVQAERAAGELGMLNLRCSALVALAEVDRRQGRVTEARSRLAESARLAAGLEDSILEIRSGFVLAALRANSDGEAESALDDLRRSVAIAESGEDAALLAEGQLRISALLMNLGRLTEAEQELESCLEGASEMGSRKVEAEATAWLGGMKYYLGDVEAGKRLGLQASEWLERTGDSYFLVQNFVWLATYALLENEPVLAEAYLTRAMPVALEIGGWIVVQVYRYLAEALVQQARVGEAQELVAFAARNLPEEDAYARSELLVAEAAVATATGEKTAASTALGEALRLLEDLNMPAQLAECRLALARALGMFGDVVGARIEFERARSAFARMEARTLVDLIDKDMLALDAGSVAEPT